MRCTYLQTLCVDMRIWHLLWTKVALINQRCNLEATHAYLCLANNKTTMQRRLDCRTPGSRVKWLAGYVALLGSDIGN